MGIGNALVDVGLFTLMTRLAPDEVLARVFGLLESLISLTVGLGAVIASLLIDLTGARAALVIVGALCPILVPTIEQPARALEPIGVPAGRVLFRQGDRLTATT